MRHMTFCCANQRHGAPARLTLRFCQHLQVRWHLHSAGLQKFFANKTHKKYCGCGKPSALLLDRCSFCGEQLGDEHIAPLKRDPLHQALLASGDFQELHRSFHLLVLEHRFPVGKRHLLVLPKGLGSWKLAHSDSTLVQLVWAHAEGFGTLAHAGTFYDLRQLRKRDAPLLEKMYQKGLECLQQAEPSPVACGFSYPADYNHLYLHLVEPPFKRLELFQRHVFYPLPEVQMELRRKGIVRPHPILDDGEEAQNKWIMSMQSWAQMHPAE
ncbi:unnamed protein product [Effrenium voratum]|uniref:Uncharacterized protein n=1 Tax=Effrenium voratum TaxID=2562239 RepID=A0AA36I409_9DINO|nr:unnamed protein product [Effrenium voratum]